jgi:hypothetical protein
MIVSMGPPVTTPPNRLPVGMRRGLVVLDIGTLLDAVVHCPKGFLGACYLVVRENRRPSSPIP